MDENVKDGIIHADAPAVDRIDADWDLILQKLDVDDTKRKIIAAQQSLLDQCAGLASQGKWEPLFRLTEVAMNSGDVCTIWNRLQYLRGLAAEQIGEWEEGASSWLWSAQEEGISGEEAVQRLRRSLMCKITGGDLDGAEKELYEEQGVWPDGDFSEVYEEFRRINYTLCFLKPEEERLSSLLIVPPGQEGVQENCHERSNSLLGMHSASYHDIMLRLTSYEFIWLYELCRNPALEQAFTACMAPRCAWDIERDREYMRCKEAQPVIPLKEAVWVLRKVERLARVSAVKYVDTPDYGGSFYRGVLRFR